VTSRSATRAEVYAAIDGERDYQDSRWNEGTTESGGRHTPTEFLLYMADYVREAITQASRNADPVANDLVLNTIRKITTLGVACMEQNGAPRR
jgi:hypothetical protein